MKVYTYRYMWKVSGEDNLKFKIVSDVEEGHKFFQDELLKIENLDSCAYEYLHEYDVERIGIFTNLYKKEI